MAEIIDGIKGALKRRWALLIIPPILFVGLSIAAIHFVTPKYTSSTTMLVQEDNITGTLVIDERSSDLNRMRKKPNPKSEVNNFVKSRLVLNKLMGSVPLASEYPKGKSKRKIIENLRSRIETSSPSPNIIKLSFTDGNPKRAKEVVEFLSNDYIKTQKQLHGTRAEDINEFYSHRLAAVQKKLKQQQNNMNSGNSTPVKDSPVHTQFLEGQLKNVNGEISLIRWKIHQEKQREGILQSFKKQPQNNFSVQALNKLPLQQMPQGTALVPLLNKYNQLHQNYTDNYPPLQSLKRKIESRTDRMIQVVAANKKRLLKRKKDLLGQRRSIAGNLGNSYVADQVNKTQESGYAAYQQLYNKIKQERTKALLNNKISNKAAGKYRVMDAASLPSDPSSPQKNTIIAVSLILGFLAGGVMIVIAEALDTTIRSDDDLLLDKPVIAYLSDGKTK